MNSSKKIILGMSGGVDSSISAVILKDMGYKVSGLFMKNWEEDDTNNQCSSKKDYEDALRISKKLGIKLSIVNFSDKYWDLVFKNFIIELNQGKTPNPDIFCNEKIKFDYFMNHALSLGCDKVATGHYAMLKNGNEINTLHMPLDKIKDQTYFLYILKQKIMKDLLFPLENIHKNDVKKIAKDFDLKVYEKKESMGICFIGKKDFSRFIQKYINSKPGLIIDEDGHELGEHHGLFNYTIGQRRGINIGGKKGYPDKPWFVIKKVMSNNTLIISQDESRLLRNGDVNISKTNWINIIPQSNIIYHARFRHGGKLIPIKISLTSDTSVKIKLMESERAITPGQSAVIYKDDECIGGGIIDA
tara:strand:- start:1380 stop:2456 length:1077 start_codon:yes stop_codon:yes gene_type:complete